MITPVDPVDSTGGLEVYLAFEGDYQDVSGKGQTTLYVDGMADSTFSGSDNIHNLTADASVSIGRRASHEDRYFPGSLDEVAIYDRALSAAEVAYLAGRTGTFERP